VLVSNRSYDRALNLATEFGGRAVRFDDCLPAMAEADIVVSSTGSPQTILHRADVASVMAGRRNRPLFLIDIAVPRDIAPDVEQLDNVYLYNVDHLEALVRENVRLREQELARCQRSSVSERDADARFTPAWNSVITPGFNHNPTGRWAVWSPAPADVGHRAFT